MSEDHIVRSPTDQAFIGILGMAWAAMDGDTRATVFGVLEDLVRQKGLNPDVDIVRKAFGLGLAFALTTNENPLHQAASALSAGVMWSEEAEGTEDIEDLLKRLEG